MSYTPPSLPLNVTWEGASAYVAPTTPLDVTWEDASDIPTNLRTSAVTATSARLEWDAPT